MPSALPKTQVFRFSWVCFVTLRSLHSCRALQAIPAATDTSIHPAMRGGGVALGPHCLVMRRLQILKLSLVVAQNQPNTISRAQKALPCSGTVLGCCAAVLGRCAWALCHRARAPCSGAVSPCSGAVLRRCAAVLGRCAAMRRILAANGTKTPQGPREGGFGLVAALGGSSRCSVCLRPPGFLFPIPSRGGSGEGVGVTAPGERVAPGAAQGALSRG